MILGCRFQMLGLRTILGSRAQNLKSFWCVEFRIKSDFGVQNLEVWNLKRFGRLESRIRSNSGVQKTILQVRIKNDSGVQDLENNSGILEPRIQNKKPQFWSLKPRNQDTKLFLNSRIQKKNNPRAWNLESKTILEFRI